MEEIQRNKNDSNFIDFKTARAIARKVIRKAERESWRRYVSSITQWMPVTAIWKKIHKIAGKYVRDNVPVLIHTVEMVADTKKVADILAEYFSKITRGEHLSIEFLNKTLIDEQILIDFNTDVHYSYNDAFDMRELRSAL